MLRHTAATAAALFAMISPAYAQNTSSAATPPPPQVRFIHALSQGGEVDVQIGQETVFSAVAPQTVTPQKPLSQAGNKEVRVRVIPAGGGQPIESEKEYSFDDAEKSYTILATPAKEEGEAGKKAEIVVLEMDRLDEGAQKAQVSLINAVPDVRALDLFLDEDKLHAGVNYQGINGPDEVEPGPHKISVLTNDEKVVMPPSIPDLTPGQSYTAIAMGTMAQGPVALFVNDATGTAMNQEGAATGTSDASTTATATGGQIQAITPVATDTQATTAGAMSGSPTAGPGSQDLQTASSAGETTSPGGRTTSETSLTTVSEDLLTTASR